MGCCNTTSRTLPPTEQKLRECVESGSEKQLIYYLSLKNQELCGKLNIDLLTFKNIEGSEINILGYCLINGRLDLIKCLASTYHASFASMESYFRKSGTTGLYIICENNYSEILEYYLPIFIKAKDEISSSSSRRKSITERSTSIPEPAPLIEEFTPIQQACWLGNIAVVKYALAYAATTTVPEELNVDYQNKASGLNCALIACKAGSYNMIKFLHMQGVSFSAVNKNKENALQVLAIEAGTRNLPEFYQCLVYLVDKVQIDITYEHLKTLKLLEKVKAADYLTQKLVSKGITVSATLDLAEFTDVDIHKRTVEGRSSKELPDLAIIVNE